MHKSINFLIGSGASADYIPTLKIIDGVTYEDLLTECSSEDIKALILFQYYKNIISKSYCEQEDIDESANSIFEKVKKKILEKSGTEEEACRKGKAAKEKIEAVLPNYKYFLQNLIPLLERRQLHTVHRANIFTTNYDLFFELAADALHKKHSFILNDGSLGLIARKLSISNFHLSTVHQGTHDNYRYEIPTINLIKMHGSVSWSKENDETISVIYSNSICSLFKEMISNHSDIAQKINDKWNIAIDAYSLVGGPLDIVLTEDERVFLQKFAIEYKTIAIVNPTKEKFSETVFQQHYYQSLRLLSYELEKPQAVLICYGFSFQDEHIREIILRSLTNRQLQVYIFVYSQKQFNCIPDAIKKSSNVFCIPTDKEIIKEDDGSKEVEIKRAFRDFIECLFKS